MDTINKKAKHYLKFFKVGTRDDKSEYTFLRDDKPEELYKSIRLAHGDRFPDDFVYDTYMSILENIDNYEVDTIDQLDDIRSELVDSMVDTYTHDLLKWLASDINNVYLLTDVIEEYNPKDGFQLLSMAQYNAIDDIFNYVYQLLEA